jgi:signal transduction histidine kinase
MVTQQAHRGTRLEDRLSRGLLAWRDKYVAWVRRHPRLVDAVLVALIVLLSVPHLAILRGSALLWQLLLLPALLLPLVWRRRAPFAVFLIIAAAALVQSFTRQPLTDDVALLVAFYTVAAYERPRRILAAALVLEAGAVPVALWQAVPPAHLIVVASALVTVAGLIGYYLRTRRAFLASLVGRAERLERERDREALLAAAAERARIAREMHDIVAHNLAVMIALADGAAYTARADPRQAVAIMGQVSGTGRSALTEMRRLLGVMREPAAAARPDHAPQPALADVDDLLETVRAAGLPTALTVSGSPSALPLSVQLALYRLIQEALTNTLKHAGATAARVCLSYRPGEIELEIIDNGRPGLPPVTGRRATGPTATGPTATGPTATGMSATGPGAVGPAAASVAAAGSAGHGIVGMRERAAVFGGLVAAGPRPAGGWRVHTVLRLDPQPPLASGVAAGPIPTG